MYNKYHKILVKQLSVQLDNLKTMIAYTKLSDKSKITKVEKRELMELEETSWFKYLPGDSSQGFYDLIDLRVTAFLRNSNEVLIADVQEYIRALTRGSIQHRQ